MAKIYIDTNVIVYALEDSKNVYGKEIAVSSSSLLWKSISCKYKVVISSWMLEELSDLRKLEQAQTLLKILRKKTIKITHTQQDIDNAKKTNPANFKDELHGMLALKSKADYLVTRNVRDFQSFRNRISLVKPEKLI